MAAPAPANPTETIISTERRQFARVAFASGAELITTQEHLGCQVLDISLKGVLLQLPAGQAPRSACPASSSCRWRAGRPMPRSSPWPGNWPTSRAAMPACCAGSIDLESITHLRRLMEINLGDPAASERELKALIAAASAA